MFRRLFILAGLVLTSAAFYLFSMTPIAGAVDIEITAPAKFTIFSETHDFASRKFADPWDMWQRTDMSRGHYTNDISGFKISRGMLSGKSNGTDAYFHPLFPGYRDAVPIGRDGQIHRIETSRYDRFSVRMYSSRKTAAQVIWFFNTVWTDAGSQKISVKPGWHTYTVNLSNNPKWYGRPLGLRFDPTYHDNTFFKVDWMRLHRSSKRRVKLSWTDDDPGSVVKIYLDKDTKGGNNPLWKIKTRVSQRKNTILWDPSGYPPRSYHFYIKKEGQRGVYSKKVRINRTPLITILNPDARGGKDFASSKGNPWDMSGYEDLAHWDALKNMSFNKGIFTATTVHDDGYFHLRVPGPIDANKYHRLTFRYRYDGPFDFGLGTMSRFIWSPDRWDIRKYSISDDIVVYPEWTTYTTDLKKMPLDAGRLGWRGLVREFRFDPLEVPAPWRFQVDFIRLSADDQANKGLTVRWRERRQQHRRTTVAIYYDTNSTGFNGRLIKGGLRSLPGNNQYRWDTSSVPEGRYWVYMKINDGISKIKKYATGPV